MKASRMSLSALTAAGAVTTALALGLEGHAVAAERARAEAGSGSYSTAGWTTFHSLPPLPVIPLPASSSGLEPSSPPSNDVRAAAASLKADIEQVVAAHVGADAFSSVTTELETKYSDIYVSAGLANPSDGQPNAWVVFTAQPPVDALVRLRSVGIPIDVQVGAPLSALEYERFNSNLLTTLGETGLIHTASTIADPTRRHVTVKFSPKPGTTAETLDAAVGGVDNVARRSVGDAAPKIALQTRFGIATEEVVARGGERLDSPDGNCTSAFAVRRSNGARGLATAKHCPNNMDYLDINGVTEFGVHGTNFATSDSVIDSQFERILSGHSVVARFKAGSSVRSVLSVANPPTNAGVCKQGITTGFTCATVVDANTCVRFPSATKCRLVITNRDVSEPGDSGGPWFRDNQASGTHVGATAGEESYFLRIGAAETSLDAVVLLDN